MKKLICSLMVATMLFSTVMSSAGASERCNDGLPRKKQRISEEEIVETLNNNTNFDNIKKFFDFFGINDSTIKWLDNFFFIKRYNGEKVIDEVIYDTIAYLVKNGVDRDTCIDLWVSAGVPSFLETEDGRFGAMDLLAYFCEKYGAVCVLASGDVISSDGKIYDCYGNEYNEEGVTAKGNTYVTSEHFLFNSFNLKSNLMDRFDKPLRPYGIFVLPDGRGFSCHFKDTEENRFIDLGEVESMVGEVKSESTAGEKEEVEIKISDGEVILPNGLKLEAKIKKPIDETVDNVITIGFSQLIFDLVRHGNATDYVECIMRCFANVDKEVELAIYNDEESLKAFALENFCCTSLDIAMECLRKEKKYSA